LADSRAGYLVGRVPGESVVLSRANGFVIDYFTPDEAESLAEQLLDQVREIREGIANAE
jgi:hypothetical protein